MHEENDESNVAQACDRARTTSKTEVANVATEFLDNAVVRDGLADHADES